jgi:beta-mannosidase
MTLEVGDPDPAIDEIRCWTEGRDGLRLAVPDALGSVQVALVDGDRVIREETVAGEVSWTDLPVESWWPNGCGDHKLYTVTVRQRDAVLHTGRVGFKDVRWEQCEGAPAEADPWVCVVNDQPLFLQGINWTPIRPNFADVTEDEYRQRLETYRDLGCNVLRVWGGAFLEKQVFYDLCDELGLLVWQEFPLSSSGMDNWPPEDERSIEQLDRIARSYITRRQHHASLLMWSGGNELQGGLDGSKTGIGKPVGLGHPLIARLEQVVHELDPTRRFVPTSASGPRFVANEADFGKGLHWDVHGPWRGESEEYWRNDDALFRSELGAPGASPADLVEKYAGELATLPASLDNPLWRRTSWWIEWPEFIEAHGRDPGDLAEFVAWSQQRQATLLARAVRACKDRFRHCGGVILWMGHDSFPCTANTAILDFAGKSKPAADAVAGEFLRSASPQQ